MKIHVYAFNLRTEEGKWLVLPMDVDKLDEVLGDDEYKVYDHDAPFYIDEFTNIHELNEQLIELETVGKDFDECELEALLEWADDIEEAISWLKEGCVRFYDTGVGDPKWSDLAELLVYDYDYMKIPERLRDYIDYDQIGRDLECSGVWYLSSNGIAVEKIH